MRNYEQKLEINWFIFAWCRCNLLSFLYTFCHISPLSIFAFFSFWISRALHFFSFSLFLFLLCVLILKSSWSRSNVRSLIMHWAKCIQQTNKQMNKHVTAMYNNAFICVPIGTHWTHTTQWICSVEFVCVPRLKLCHFLELQQQQQRRRCCCYCCLVLSS